MLGSIERARRQHEMNEIETRTLVCFVEQSHRQQAFLDLFGTKAGDIPGTSGTSTFLRDSAWDVTGKSTHRDFVIVMSGEKSTDRARGLER